MARRKGIITRSNYTIKQPVQKLGDGSIVYERDFMTTTNLGGYESNSIPYGEGNFRIITTDNYTQKKRGKLAKWLTREDCTPSIVDDCTVWTLNDIVTTTESTESRIVRKPNINDLLDFAYYGSCEELIKTSVSSIIKKYPGELYISTNPYIYMTTKGDYTLGQNILDTPVVVENPFNIDIVSQTVAANKSDVDYNPLRYFAESYSQYVLLDPEDELVACLGNWTVITKTGKTCYNDGDLYATIMFEVKNPVTGETAQTVTFPNDTLTFYSYYMGGKQIIVTDGMYSGYKLRPKQSVVDDIFSSNFSMFQQFLLNRDTKPIYTININTLSETSKGMTKVRKSFTWPLLNGWNLDVTTSNYNNYINALLKVASDYDVYNSDNLWKNMVHESIKNMDTLKKQSDEGSDYEIGIGNIHGLMNAYGRFFDELKFAIDNIKTNNTITYDENNNIPDYFLSDVVNNSGWEVSSVVDGIDSDTTVEGLYEGELKKYTTQDMNTAFLRWLKINSKSILKKKGTRNAIESLLSLFGYSSYEYGMNYYNSLPESSKIQKNGRSVKWENLTDEERAYYYDYKLNEYVVVASNTSADIVDESEELSAETYNKLKINMGSEDNGGGVDGLPVKIIHLTYDEETDSGTTRHSLKYLVPWFDKNITMDGEPYFQMYGGWMKNEDGEYEETKEYLTMVGTISDLLRIPFIKLYNGEIVYVDDISNIGEYVPSGTTLGASNYFIINDINYSKSFTKIEGGNGWYNIPQSEIDNEIKDGIRVVRLENIINVTEGNNPHIGYGHYDSGEEYLKFFKQIFKGAINNDMFTEEAYDCNTGALDDGIVNCGFKLTGKVVDNVKCWFFTDNMMGTKIYRLYPKMVDAEDLIGNEYTIQSGYQESTDSSKINVGKAAFNNKEVQFTTDLEAFNLETQESGSNDEAAANSVINVKNVTIEFDRVKYADNKEFKKYLHSSILPYLKQIIPSTTIFEIVDIDSGKYLTGC